MVQHTIVLLIDATFLVGVCAALALFLIAVRRRILERPGGTFECSLRDGTTLSRRRTAKGWMLGLARYAGDDIEWFRMFSYSPRPRRTFTRGRVRIVNRRRPFDEEAATLMSGAVVVECAEVGPPVELGMTDSAFTGFLAWLEAAPPGQHRPVA